MTDYDEQFELEKETRQREETMQMQTEIGESSLSSTELVIVVAILCTRRVVIKTLSTKHGKSSAMKDANTKGDGRCATRKERRREGGDAN